jgi:signal transduction histidine kinase
VHDDGDGVAFEISTAGPLVDDRLERLRDRIEALDGRVGVDGRHDGGSRVQGWLPRSS